MTVGQPVRTLPWREYVDRYHYPGFARLPEAQLRCLATSQNTSFLAGLGFGACAWKVAPRGRFVGWTPQSPMR